MSGQKLHKKGLYGKKIGMTQLFKEDGSVVPVSVIHVEPTVVLEVKSQEKHGYKGVKVAFGAQKPQRLSKVVQGQFKSAEKGCFRTIKEIRCEPETLGVSAAGDMLNIATIFGIGDSVDVTGTSIGRGFAGVVKRHHAKGQPATRGTHEYRRHIGSVGCRKYPGRIFKNKIMPGHMGNEQVTIQNLEVVGIEAEKGLLLVKGGIPGSKGSLVLVKEGTK